jgi:hypothetical protein
VADDDGSVADGSVPDATDLDAAPAETSVDAR